MLKTLDIPSATSRNHAFFSWVRILIQLGLITLVISFFGIEADLGLPTFWYLLMGSFAINLLTPIQHRPAVLFFSFAAILAMFMHWTGAVKVLAAGFFLMGLCHLPVSLGWRKLLVFLSGIVLMLMVLDYLPSPFGEHQLRVVTTIFMFRVILYLYELNYEKEPVTIWRRLNYFFLSPNIIFPLFPIVDYKTFNRSYYDEEAVKIYQKGADLILVSICCLLIYRGVYQFGIPNLRDVTGLGGVLHYMISTYLTVIRLVGLLSLSVGMLRLFGFNLPKIFNHMFLATSLVDLFRRINIYWRDFLTKVIYYPIYFRLRKIAPASAVTISVMITYFFTWFFHVYQWFWVLGSDPLRENSFIFWGVFGVVATVNSLSNQVGAKSELVPNITYSFIYIGKVLSTFLLMSMLYSMWVSPSFDAWLKLLVIGLMDTTEHWLILGVWLLALWLLISIIHHLFLRYSNTENLLDNLQKLVGPGLTVGLFVFTLSFYTLQHKNSEVLIFIENIGLNDKDDLDEFAGYYDEILSVKPDVASRLWGFERNDQETGVERLADTKVNRPVQTVMLNEFIPHSQGTFKGKKISINKWGFRDRNYSLEPEPKTIRIAIVGSSPSMGAGVSDEEVFEQLVEDRLNANYGSDSLRFEILNFAKSSIGIYHHAYLLETKIHQFKPDYILNIEHCRPFLGYMRKLKRIVDAKVPMYHELDSVVTHTPIPTEDMGTDADKEKYGKVLAGWGFKHFVQLSVKYDIQPIWVFVPPISKTNFLAEYLNLAKAAGYKDIINLESIFDNYHQKLLQVGKSDRHPNVLGHRLIADGLYIALVEYFDLSLSEEVQQ